MTTDSAPRIKITYATLSADNEELHAGFEAGRRRRPRRSSAGTTRTTSTGRGAMATGTFEARSPIDRDLLARARSRRGTDGGRRRRGRRGAGRPAGLGRGALARAPRDHPPRGRATSATT